MSVTLRDADLSRDREAMLGFIMGLQHFEHRIEPNRRRDASVAGEYLDKMLRDLGERPGRVIIAEADGAPAGWAVVHEGLDDVYVLEAERRFAYVAELYLVEAARGSGAGRLLLEACEAWARERGLSVMQIGVLPGNERAKAVYAAAGFALYTTQLRKYL